ncbi:YciI family protein [Leptospira barantonii]|uniref:Transcription initiation protein n=1 Tax=Leptospira barantonii TaxID=2023184 RepID=A0ABX4NKA8_9LEPT|nr:YciI family protein [Leptospira barantonii]PJZ57245.1 transcription initiation protein [Leptospira barantonii]
MDEFLILMRLDLVTKEAQPSPEQLEVYMKQYHDWVGKIISLNKFSGGTGLSTEGKVIRSNGIVTDGPYVDIKESIAGFIVIKAKDFEEAASIAKECPILNGDGNSVEVRKIIGVHENQ